MAIKTNSKGPNTPIKISIGPIPEWGHLGLPSLEPKKRLLLVPSQGTDCVSIVSLKKLSVLSTVQLAKDSAPWHVKATPDGKFAYVSNSRFNGHVDTSPREFSTISVINLAKYKHVRDIPVMAGPLMIEMDPLRNRAYVSNRFSNTLSVIDTKVHKTIETVKVGAAPFWLKMTPKGDYLVVGSFEDATLSLIDANNLSLVNSVKVGNGELEKPYPEFGRGDTIGFTISNEGFAYVANWRSHTIVKVDIYSAIKEPEKAVVASETLVKFPFQVEIEENLGLLMVGSYDAQMSRLLIADSSQKRNAIGNVTTDMSVTGPEIPKEKAAKINYWMSEPFESRITGMLGEGFGNPNPNLIVMVL